MDGFIAAAEHTSIEFTAVLAVVLLALLGLLTLISRLASVRSTTLVAVWCWSLVALSAVAASELAVAVAGGGPAPASWVSPLRFATAMSTFCPAMALLGAKRPQDRGWQFIVLTLWVVLALPSVEWLLFGGLHEIHPARSWFLVLLIGVGMLNGIGTRFWTSIVLYAVGQMVLLAPYWATSQAWISPAVAPLAGLALVDVSWLLVAVDLPRPRPATPMDRVWFDFRDAFGLVWSLRVAERMNASAAMYGWNVTLRWRGFEPKQADLQSSEISAAVEDSLRTLLRRFVSAEWIDQRLAGVRSEDRVAAPSA